MLKYHCTQLTHATILEPVEDPILDPDLGTLNPLHKETIKDVKISSHLSRHNRMKLEHY